MKIDSSVLIIIGAILLAAGGYFLYSDIRTVSNPPVVCTQEARSCPDGSYVGRTGPNCEFAKCPEVAEGIDTSTWKTYRNEKYGFEIPYPTGWVGEPYLYESETTTYSGYKFKSNTENGYTMNFSIITSDPVGRTENINDIKKAYEAELVWAKNPRMRSVSERFHDSDIGGDFRMITIDGRILCEVARPCVVIFDFYHDELLRRGISISFQMGPLSSEDAKKSVGSNPHLLFAQERQVAEKILSTFKFTK